MKTVVISSTGSAFTAIQKGVPEENYSGSTIAEAVGGLIRICYEDLGITEDQLQSGVGLGHHWDDMSNTELYYLVVRDQGLLTVERV